MAKKQSYVVWVEGLSLKNGEKIRSISDEGIEYTFKLSKALRVSEDDLETVRDLLKERELSEIGNWFHPTTYTPAGTKFNSTTMTGGLHA